MDDVFKVIFDLANNFSNSNKIIKGMIA